MSSFSQAPRDFAMFKQFGAFVEQAVLFGVIPLFLFTGIGHAFRHLVLFLGCLYILWRMRTRLCWRFLFSRPPLYWWKWPVLRGCFVFGAAIIFISFFEPSALFIFPRQQPLLWLLVICLYPVLSVLPQELIYRVFIFENYSFLWSKPIFPVCVSTIAFAWVHIIFVGWFAFVATALGGLSLALVYQKRRLAPGAIWVLVLEHALYGLVMFTVGFGKYFFLAS